MNDSDLQTELLALQGRVFTPNYRPQALFVRGSGAQLFDAAGKRYLDMLSGLAVNAYGHCHPEIVAAVREQAGQLAHISNLYANEPALRLAEWLVERTGFERVYLCNSGTEAVEAALKLARLYQRRRGEPDRFEFVAFERAFHGRTFGSLSCTGTPKYHEGFEPLLPGVKHVPFNDLAAAEAAIGAHTAAVIVEAVQGEGGVLPAAPGFLAGLRAACDRVGCLLIVDEIQTGMGRTGHFLAHEHDGVRPDLVTLAKALGAGLPVGALLAREEVGLAMKPGTHATTFGGNPVACAAGLAGVRLLSEGLEERVREVSVPLRAALDGLKARHPHKVLEVRGRGLLMGLQLDREAKELTSKALSLGLVVGSAGTHVLRLAPPYVIEEADIAETERVLDIVLAGA